MFFTIRNLFKPPLSGLPADSDITILKMNEYKTIVDEDVLANYSAGALQTSLPCLVLTKHRQQEIIDSSYHSGGLLNHVGVVSNSTPFYSIHAHNFFSERFIDNLMRIKPCELSKDGVKVIKSYWGSGTCEISSPDFYIVQGVEGEFKGEIAAVFKGDSLRNKQDITSFLKNNLGIYVPNNKVIDRLTN
jgi:hypothetical protein